MSLATSCPGAGCWERSSRVSRDGMSLTIALTVRVVCLSSTRCADGRAGGRRRGRRSPRCPGVVDGRVRGRHDQVAARDVEVVGEQDGHRLRGPGDVDRLAQQRRCPAIVRRAAGGQHGHRLADAQHAGGDLARVAAVVGVLGGLRPDHVLHGEARAGRRSRSWLTGDGLQVLQHGRAAVPVHVRGRVHHVVAGQRGDRDRGDLRDAERGGVAR